MTADPPAGTPAGQGGDTPAEQPVDTASVVVDAPPDHVWDMVADVTRMGEWSPECTSCRWLGKRHEPVVGARLGGFHKRGWARGLTTNEVEQAERGRSFVFRVRETGVRWGYHLDGDAGTTTLTETRALSSARTWLIRLFGPFTGGVDRHADELRAGMAETLRRIKAAAEAPA